MAKFTKDQHIMYIANHKQQTNLDMSSLKSA